MNKKSHHREYKVLSVVLFLIYMIILLYVVFFAENFGRTDHARGYSYNLIPLKEIKRFIVYADTLGLEAVILNLGGNIAAFIPFGYFLPRINRNSRNFFGVVLMSMELSIVIEIVQLVFKVGSCDVDDIILNTIGGALGYIIYLMHNCFINRKGKVR